MNPPPPVHTNELPDYYLGCLIYFDEDSKDECRWVVYDGNSKVRCPTRHDAIDYIASTRLNTDEKLSRLFVDARVSLSHTMQILDRAAKYASGPRALLLQRLAVRLRPVLVELDNIIL